MRPSRMNNNIYGQYQGQPTYDPLNQILRDQEARWGSGSGYQGDTNNIRNGTQSQNIGAFNGYNQMPQSNVRGGQFQNKSYGGGNRDYYDNGYQGRMFDPNPSPNLNMNNGNQSWGNEQNFKASPYNAASNYRNQTIEPNCKAFVSNSFVRGGQKSGTNRSQTIEPNSNSFMSNNFVNDGVTSGTYTNNSYVKERPFNNIWKDQFPQPSMSNNFVNDGETTSGTNKNYAKKKPFNNIWQDQFPQPNTTFSAENYAESQDFASQQYNTPGNKRGNHHRGRGRGYQNQHHNQGQPNGGEQKKGGSKQKKRGGKQKKMKVDKRELPENNVFFCDSCDRGFPTLENYTTHTNEHVKCRYGKCPYVAAPNLVHRHFRLQHHNGMAQKIWSVESKEDIQKWKDERKKNFPTAENIARKNTMLAEKKARGEVIQTKYFGKMKGKKFNQQNLENNESKCDNDELHDNNDGPHDNNDGPHETRREKIRNRRARIRNRRKRSRKADDTEESETKRPRLEDKTDSTLEGINTQLHDVEEQTENGQKMETRVDRKPMIDSQTENKEICESTRDIIHDGNNPETMTAERCSSVNDGEQEHKKINQHQRRNDRKNNVQQSGRNRKYKRPDTLLEKLLANNIRHERNVILQCVHHIVKNKFFGIGQSTCDTSTTNESVAEGQTSSEVKERDPMNTEPVHWSLNSNLTRFKFHVNDVVGCNVHA